MNDIEFLKVSFKTCSTDLFKEILEKIISPLLSKIKNKKMDEKIKENIAVNKFFDKFMSKILCKTPKYEKEFDKLTSEMKKLNDELNKLIIERNKNEKDLFKLFKDEKNEFLKIDNMSKKYLEILNKLNWVVIDPGMNSLFTMSSNNKKIKYDYTKQLHLNRTSYKRMIKRIEKHKIDKIKKIESELSKEDNRGKTSNLYEDFLKYYNKKIKSYHELTKLYNCKKLNKMKWNHFINGKRSENMLVNDIKSKFGNDVVLILGDWSMNKGMIRGQSPTPNKKYTKILENNLMTLKIDEFRTSIVHNKNQIRCTNDLKKDDFLKKDIKYVHSMEKLKEKDEEKYKNKLNEKVHKILVCKTNGKSNEYVNRDNNSNNNMIDIVMSYIKTNYKPNTFVRGTYFCN
jgi:hypothetical protein